LGRATAQLIGNMSGNQRRRDLFIAQDEVEEGREALIADVEVKLKQQQELKPLFTIRWRLA